MCPCLSRLLRLVDLPTLDGVLSHDAVDGKHIVRNIKPLARLVKLARHTAGADSQGMSAGWSDELCAMRESDY